MLYNQPYGVSDTNAAYINGNPSTGQMGSIPPAASIEYPQREIVNLITDAGLNPTNGDLHQLAKGVQSGQLIYGDDTGAANQVSIAVHPPVTTLIKGMQFITIFAHDNTGPASASVSGLGFIEIVHPIDRTSLNPLELRAGSIGCLAYDGTKFQLAWSNVVGSTGGQGQPIYLTQPLDYYVNWSTGVDTNDGTAATTTAGTVKGPFKTPQKAMDTIQNFNLNGFNITVHVADSGNYPGINLKRLSGSGNVIWQGNQTSPGNVVLTGNGFSAIRASQVGNYHIFNGFGLATTGAFTNEPMCGINCNGAGTSVGLNDMVYFTVSGSHIAVTQAAVVGLGGKQIINGHAQGANPQMTSGWWLYVAQNSIVQPNGGYMPNLNINGSFGGQNGGGLIVCANLSFVEAFFASISGYANWGGQKYNVSGNAILTTHGGGPSYLPGSVAGVVNTGGQYS
jgi:hypothetical protein